MKEINARNSGFGLIGVLIVIAVIVVIGAVGLVTYNHNHRKMIMINLSTKSSSHKPKTTSKSATTKLSTSSTATQTNSNTFAIPEFDIQITLPAELSASGLEYVAHMYLPATTGFPTTYSTASFTSKSLLQLDSGCTADNISLGVIYQFPQNPGTSSAIHVGS